MKHFYVYFFLLCCKSDTYYYKIDHKEQQQQKIESVEQYIKVLSLWTGLFVEKTQTVKNHL